MQMAMGCDLQSIMSGVNFEVEGLACNCPDREQKLPAHAPGDVTSAANKTIDTATIRLLLEAGMTVVQSPARGVLSAK